MSELLSVFCEAIREYSEHLTQSTKSVGVSAGSLQVAFVLKSMVADISSFRVAQVITYAIYELVSANARFARVSTWRKRS